MDKGKAKMAEYEDDRFDDNASTHSLDSELGRFDVPLESYWHHGLVENAAIQCAAHVS